MDSIKEAHQNYFRKLACRVKLGSAWMNDKLTNNMTRYKGVSFALLL